MSKYDDFYTDDFGDDFDLGLGDDKPKTTSQRIKTFGKSVVGGVGKSFTDGDNVGDLVRHTLPKGYGSAYSVGLDSYRSAESLYNEARVEAEKVTETAKEATEKLLPLLSNVLPDAVLEKVQSWSETRIRKEDQQRRSEEDSLVMEQMGDLFGALDAKQELRDESQLEHQARTEVTENKRHMESIDVLDRTRIGVERLVNYQDKITANYQRKSLELKIRSYFVATKTLESIRANNEDTQANLKSIYEGLIKPDLVKLREHPETRELYGADGSRRRERLFGSRSNYFQRAKEGLTKKASQSIQSIGEGLRSGLSMGSDVASMMGSMGDMVSKEEMAGEMVGGSLPGMLAKRFGHRIRKRVDANDKLRRLGGRLQYGVDNMEQIIQSTQDGEDYEYDDQGNRKFNLKKMLGGLIRGAVGDDRAGTTLAKESLQSLQAPHPFTRQTNRSINEVIPGLLSRIHREILVLRTGDESAKALQYDFLSSKFTDHKTLGKKTIKRLLSNDSGESLARNAYGLIDGIDDGSLTKEQRRAIALQLIDDNYNKKLASKTRLTDASSFSKLDPETAQKLAGLFGTHLADDDDYQKVNAFATRYNQLGTQIQSNAVTMQDHVETGLGQYMKKAGLIKNGQLDKDRLIEMMLDSSEDRAKGLGYEDESDEPSGPNEPPSLFNQFVDDKVQKLKEKTGFNKKAEQVNKKVDQVTKTVTDYVKTTARSKVVSDLKEAGLKKTTEINKLIKDIKSSDTQTRIESSRYLHNLLTKHRAPGGAGVPDVQQSAKQTADIFSGFIPGFSLDPKLLGQSTDPTDHIKGSSSILMDKLSGSSGGLAGLGSSLKEIKDSVVNSESLRQMVPNLAGESGKRLDPIKDLKKKLEKQWDQSQLAKKLEKQRDPIKDLKKELEKQWDQSQLAKLLARPEDPVSSGELPVEDVEKALNDLEGIDPETPEGQEEIESIYHRLKKRAKEASESRLVTAATMPLFSAVSMMRTKIENVDGSQLSSRYQKLRERKQSKITTSLTDLGQSGLDGVKGLFNRKSADGSGLELSAKLSAIATLMGEQLNITKEQLGPRVGSAQWIKEQRLLKRKEKKDVHKRDVEQTSALSGMGGMFKKLGGLFGFGSDDGEEDSGGDTYIYGGDGGERRSRNRKGGKSRGNRFTRGFRRGKDFTRGAGRTAKGLGGALRGGKAVGDKLGGGVLRSAGRLGKRGAVSAGKGLGKTAMRAGLGLGRMGLSTLLMGGGIGNAIGGTILSTAGSAMLSGLGMAAGAAGAVLASPVVLGALATAGVAAAGYGAYKFFTRLKPTDLNRVRMAQYGYDPEDGSKLRQIATLESEVAQALEFNSEGMPRIVPDKLKYPKILKAMGVSVKDREQLVRLSEWINNRFAPVYLVHVGVLQRIAKTNDLTKIEDLEKKDKIAYLEGIKFEDGPYDVGVDPKTGEPLPSNRDTVLTMWQKARDPLGSAETEDTKPSLASTIAKAVVPGLGAYEAVREKMGRDKEAGVKTSVKDIVATAAKSTLLGRLVTGAKSMIGAVLGKRITNPNDIKALDAIRYKLYGLKDMNLEKINTLREVERECSQYLEFSADGDATWNHSIEDFIKEHGGKFGIVSPDSDEAVSLTKWFTNRFLPLYTRTMSFLYRIHKDTDLEAMIERTPAPDRLDLANLLLATTSLGEDRTPKSVWMFSDPAWPGYELNTDYKSVEGNLAILRDDVKKTVLPEQTKPEVKTTTGSSSSTGSSSVSSSSGSDWSPGKSTQAGFTTDSGSGMSKPDSFYDTSTSQMSVAASDVSSYSTGTPAEGKQAIIDEMTKEGMSSAEIAALMGNIAAESNFVPKSENLSGYANTSNERIRSIFVSKTKGLTDEQLNEIKKDPKKFGDLVYSHLGGYAYRGRGHVQLTGKGNYERYSKLIFGDDRLVQNPDLVNDPVVAAKVAVAYHKDRAHPLAKKLYGKTFGELTPEEMTFVTTQAIAGEGTSLKSGYLADLTRKKAGLSAGFLKELEGGGLAASESGTPVSAGTPGTGMGVAGITGAGQSSVGHSASTVTKSGAVDKYGLPAGPSLGSVTSTPPPIAGPSTSSTAQTTAGVPSVPSNLPPGAVPMPEGSVNPDAKFAGEKAVLTREQSEDHGTFGTLRLPDGTTYLTLELPWRDNKPMVSCIPAGTYQVKYVHSPRYGTLMYRVMDVPNRDGILFHSGNTAGNKDLGQKSDVAGCILLGYSKGTKGGQPAILESKAAMTDFTSRLAGRPFELTITGGGTDAPSVDSVAQNVPTPSSTSVASQTNSGLGFSGANPYSGAAPVTSPTPRSPSGAPSNLMTGFDLATATQVSTNQRPQVDAQTKVMEESFNVLKEQLTTQTSMLSMLSKIYEYLPKISPESKTDESHKENGTVDAENVRVREPRSGSAKVPVPMVSMSRSI